ncbi:MAG: ribonuclease Y, partial [Candidatus Stahlbacteria bacterium]|nr:ribonuclease Y [Candidatus Stahlbacteria bacterium]
MVQIAYIIGCIVIAAIFFFIGVSIRRTKAINLKTTEETAEKMIADAKKDAERYKATAELEMKTEWNKKTTEFEREIRNRRDETEKREKYLDERGKNLERKADLVARKEAELSKKEIYLLDMEKQVVTKGEKLEVILAEENRKLEKIAGMNQEEARQHLFQNLEKKVREEAKEFIRGEREKAKAEAGREAKRIISTAIERCTTEYVLESTSSTVALPSDEMKGRMIGREGRNIRAFETATGVDLLIDDTPGIAFISSLDPIRREIARTSLEKLILDGRIHPARIEEIVDQVRKEFPGVVQKIGEDIAIELKVSDIHPELIKLLGQLRFRTSYGQNVLAHSKEVAHLSSLMAAELGLSQDIAKRAGLLHDIGKSVSQEYEGTHQKIGAEFARRFGESDIVINAIEAHHKDIEPTSPIAVLVEASDAISGARPGARRESLEAYVERIEKLEQIVSSFNGVEKTYAIQAGREVRVIVEPDRVSDSDLTDLANEISHKIEEEMKYPGE